MALLKSHRLAQLGFTALLLALIAVLETKAALSAFSIAGWLHAALSGVCALLAFFSFGFAGRLKDDERRHIALRARAVRVVALCFLIVPVGYLGSSFKADRLASQWEAYSTSPAYAADVALSQDMMADRIDRQQATRRLIEPTTPDLTLADGEWWMAAFFQFLLIFASDALRVPAPITEAERQAMMFKRRGEKAAATRRRKKAAKETRKGFGVLTGGKT